MPPLTPYKPITSLTMIESLNISPELGGIVTILRRDGSQESFLLDRRMLESLYRTLGSYLVSTEGEGEGERFVLPQRQLN